MEGSGFDPALPRVTLIALDLPKLKATGKTIRIARTDFLGKNGSAKAASQ